MVKHTQTIRRQQPTICLSVFNHFVELARKAFNFLVDIFHNQMESTSTNTESNIYIEEREVRLQYEEKLNEKMKEIQQLKESYEIQLQENKKQLDNIISKSTTIEENETEIESLKAKIEQSQIEEKTLRQHINESKEIIEQYKTKLEECEKSIVLNEQNKEHVNNEKDLKIKELLSQLFKCSDDLSNKEKSINDLKDALKNKDQETKTEISEIVLKSEEQVKLKKEEVESLRRVFEEQSQKMKTKLTEYENELALLKLKVNEKQLTVNNLRTEIEELMQLSEKCKHEVEELRESNEKSKLNLSDKNTEIQEFHIKVDQLSRVNEKRARG